ncbi:MAG: HEPN domain-containing protein [Crenarchaeota archaeon]|nr:HEPN domain-containing protein [Thermoproteota archaeon]
MLAESYLSKAKENLRIAEIAFEEGCYNASVNRAYYAMLQAAIAALLNGGIEPKLGKGIDHGWIQSRFSADKESHKTEVRLGGEHNGAIRDTAIT